MPTRLLTKDVLEEVRTLGGHLQAIASALTDPSVQSPFSEITLYQLNKASGQLNALYPPEVDERENMSLKDYVIGETRAFVVENSGDIDTQAIADRCFGFLNGLKMETFDTPGAIPCRVLQEANQQSGTPGSEFFQPEIENVLLGLVEEYTGKNE